MKRSGKKEQPHAARSPKKTSARITTQKPTRQVSAQKRAQAELRENITQRQRAEEAWRESEARIRAILDATHEAIALVGPDQTFLHINRRFTELFGVSAHELLGHRFEDIYPLVERVFTDPMALLLGVQRTAVDVEGVFREIVTQRWPQPRELEIYSPPVHSADKVYLGRLFVVRDVTHEREVDRMKSEFVSLVSHELRTPLTSIKGYVELLLDGEVGKLTEKQQQFLGIIKNNGDRLVCLISDLLDLSRIEAGKLELKREALALNELVKDVAISFQPQIEAKNQTLTFDLAEGLPAVWGDRERVVQILTNLISNAHKYTLADGHIRIAARLERDKVRVDVADSGIGLTLEEQSKVFTRFYRAKNPLTQQVSGTGLGLVITRSLVEMHGGEITVNSTPGQGTVFSFTLPYTTQLTSPKVDAHLLRRGKKILVVDDELDIANLLRRYLERVGFSVFVANNGRDAFQIARREQPDLITLDIQLPDVDGFTVLQWLKGNTETSKIPILVVSVLPETDQGKLLGSVGYITKPLRERNLLEQVGQILVSAQERPVLLVEDDADSRGLLAQYLRQAGYHVVEAQDGAEAVDIARNLNPGLVLMDIKMPVMDGVTALRKLREDETTRGLPVIMMTASPGALEESRVEAEMLGASALLNKPFTADELAGIIAQALISGVPE